MNHETVKEKIRKKIFDSIITNEVFGFTNLWQNHMKRDVIRSVKSEYRNAIDEVIDDLIKEGVLEEAGTGNYRVTLKGQD